MDKLHLFMNIEYLVHKQHRVLSKRLKKYNITPEQAAILFFIKKEEKMNQRRLADLFHISMASLSVRLQRLEKEGYIVRLEDQEDRRILWLSLNDKGSNIVESCFKELNDLLEIMFFPFSEEELNMFESFVKKTRHQLKVGEVTND